MQQELKLKKADIILAVVFVLLAGAIFFWSYTYFTDSGSTLKITADGKEIGDYSLSRDCVIVIKDGEICGTLEGDELIKALDDAGGRNEESMKKAADGFALKTLGDGAYDSDVNVVAVSEGRVHMSSAGCDNQHCVHHTDISRGNEQIVCLPNRVILQITDSGESEIDIVAN